MIIFKFLFIILLVFLFLVVVLGSSFIKIISSLFSGKPQGAQQHASSTQRRTGTSRRKENKQPASDKKIISRDEGEYIDFEEIKD